jgi:hypothetical protein
MAVLETTFVIDLMKESKRGRIGPASLKLHELTARGESLQIAIFTLAELYVGATKGNPTSPGASGDRAERRFVRRLAV